MKTDAGARSIKIRGALAHELLGVRNRSEGPAPDAFVFPAATGKTMSTDNFRGRVLRPAVTRANQDLAARDQATLPQGITPHALRRSFASLLYALGEDPGVVMDEMGHTDPALALRVYRQAMRRDNSEKAKLRALVGGAFGPFMNPQGAFAGSEPIKTAGA